MNNWEISLSRSSYFGDELSIVVSTQEFTEVIVDSWYGSCGWDCHQSAYWSKYPYNYAIPWFVYNKNHITIMKTNTKNEIVKISDSTNY